MVIRKHLDIEWSWCCRHPFWWL